MKDNQIIAVVKLALLAPPLLAGRVFAQVLGPDESSIVGIATPPNFILYEETYDTLGYDMSSSSSWEDPMPLRIKSDVPVTVQRYDDINQVISSNPIGNGEGVILVTSDCDTVESTAVPVIEISTDDETNATVVTVTLGVVVDDSLPFLKSSSYEAVFYENSYIQYTASDIGPEDPIVEYVPCMTEDDCREASTVMGIQFFYVGEYATSGCFYKNDRAYWSTVGDPAGGVIGGIRQRLWCKEVYYIGDVGVDVGGGAGTCTTQDQCDQKRSELGIGTFVPGSFPTKGCFSKEGENGVVAYWSEGGTDEEMSTTELPGVQERITCEGGDVVVDTGSDTTCTTQDQCDQKRFELGIGTFVPGNFPTKGCFSKAGENGVVAYWSEGGTDVEMSTTDLPGVQERITCEGVPPTGDVVCETGPNADPTKICATEQFCKLDAGVCNAKSGLFVGVCVVKPEVCIEVYDPVCGCDNTTYGNDCVAFSQGISVSRVGECEVEVFTASQAIAYPEYITTKNSESATSSAFHLKSFVLSSIFNNAISSQVAKSPSPRSRLLQDTCTYNVEILLNGCYAGYSAPIEVSAPKARVINSVMEIVDTETVAFYESSEGFYGQEFKHTATLTFPDDQEQLIDVASDTYASVPALEPEGTCTVIMVGRPFVDSSGHSLVASSISANVCSDTSSWLGETLTLAHEGELIASVVNTTNQNSLGEKWTINALGEHASVASFAAFSIALMTNHAPSDLVEDSLKAALDEVRHAKTSFAIASKLSGKDVFPGPLPHSNHQFNRDLSTLAISVAQEGCVDETLSALSAAADVELINEVLKNGVAVGSKYYGIGGDLLVWIRDELSTISMDESNHSALAWRTLDWVCRVDADACGAAKQSVLSENKLIESFQRRFGRNLEYSPELLERMMMTWRKIYTGRGLLAIPIEPALLDAGVEKGTGNHASNPSFMSILVDNISRGGSYST